MKRGGVQTGASEPGSDCELAVPEDPHGSTDTQAFGQGAQDFTHATGGSFEAVQDRAIADAELRLAGLALEILNVFMAAVATTTDKGMDLIIGNAKIEAVGVWTGVVRGALVSVYGAEAPAADTAVWLANTRDEHGPSQPGIGRLSIASLTVEALREIQLLDDIIATKEGLVIYPAVLNR